MPKKLLSLGTDGKLVLRLPDGRVEALPAMTPAFQTVFLLIDCSGSMSDGKLKQAQSGALSFAADALGNGYHVGLIRFESTATILCKPTRDLAGLRRRIQSLATGGSTDMTHALQLAFEDLSATVGTRAIVVVTDGMPDKPGTALETARQAKGNGIDIIAIGTDDADKDFLGKLASRSDLMVKVSRELLGQSIASAAKLLPGPSR